LKTKSELVPVGEWDWSKENAGKGSPARRAPIANRDDELDQFLLDFVNKRGHWS
jgi:hypothetical protein